MNTKSPGLIPPRFRKALRPQTVPEGEAVIFEVEVESLPDSGFTWQQHGVPIQVFTKYNFYLKLYQVHLLHEYGYDSISFNM